MTLIEDPKLTYSEANYLTACVLIVQRSDPRYAADTVLTQAHDKIMAKLSKHAMQHPEDVEAVQADIDLQRQLREED